MIQGTSHTDPQMSHKMCDCRVSGCWEQQWMRHMETVEKSSVKGEPPMEIERDYSNSLDVHTKNA